MAALDLLELYPSPWSDRLRWTLDHKGIPYTRRSYLPIAGEEDLVETTGIRTVPVLFADGEVIGDSNAAVDWIEDHHESPALLPADPHTRAQVRAWELMATECLAPAARLVLVGRYRDLGIQPLGDHFAAKYGWSEQAAREADRLLGRILPELAAALRGRAHLVGTSFTRADLTMACMLTPAIGVPPDDVFELDAGLRGMFGIPLAGESSVTPLAEWRDETYRRHRGRRVTPVVPIAA